MPLSERTRVMIVDDHLIFRMGLKQVLEQTEEFEVVGEAADGEEAVRVATEVSPDVMVMDVMMPVKDGVEACREIMESSPETRVVMLTASTEENAVVEALAAGATGYLQKETGLDRLLGTMRDVGKGELRVPADAVSSVLAGLRIGVKAAHATDASDAAGLTQREREILISFAQGKTYAHIAEERGVKAVTVRNAVYSIQVKLKVETMQELVLWAARHGLVEHQIESA